MAKFAVIIPAAGFGKRMGHEIAKQFIKVGGKTILAHTVIKIQTWASHYQHDVMIMVALSNGVNLPADVIANGLTDGFKVKTCVGGKERADSVANALSALENIGQFDWAMVHDAARPLVAIENIEKLYQTLKDDNIGGILAEKVTATVKQAKQNHSEVNTIITTLPREDLWLAQTPQLFRFALLKRSLQEPRHSLTDEASGIERLGYAPKIIEGNRNNIKITTPEDLLYFTQRITNHD